MSALKNVCAVDALAFFALRESSALRTAIFVVSAEEFHGPLSGQNERKANC
jgi:hypothetical protein